MESEFFTERKSNHKKSAVIAAIGVLAVVGVIATIAVCSSSPATPALIQYQLEEQEFHSFMGKFSKSYSEEEYAKRFEIFRENSAFVRVFNTQGKTWTLEVNKFADLSFAEFKSIYTPFKFPPRDNLDVKILENLTVPTQVDWTTKGAVTAVKDQGQCGSCWSFSTTGSTEGAWFLAGHTLVSLSEQQLIDCSIAYGNLGCNGGIFTEAMKYIAANGITTEANYPYNAKMGLCNKTKVKQIAATSSGHKDVFPDNIDQLYIAVAQQPVSVAVEADQAAWQMYQGGIVSSNCGTATDHAVLVVGYNQVNNPPYWKVKNSWGESWGEAGFIRIAVVAGKGVCGIQTQPAYPII